MAGFKDGTVNGWEDDTDEQDPDETVADTTAAGSDSSEDENNLETAVTESSPESSGVTQTGSETTTSSIPWVLRRNSITDGREQTVQLHLQEETLDVQRTQKSIIESRLGESVRKADLREAALLVGLQHTDDVVSVLEEWGYAIE
jgi:hypothetical protein